MLEKAEGAFKNGQSRDTANIGNTRQNKQSKTHNTTQNCKKMSNTQTPTKNRGMNPGACEG
jgi:hypothetical protein